MLPESMSRIVISDAENAAHADPSRNVVIRVWSKYEYPEFPLNFGKEREEELSKRT
jgi:hypothetical protein